MKHFLILIVLSFCTLPSLAKIKTQFNYTQIANFIYQLDCVSKLPLHCSQMNYDKLWDNEFSKTELDRLQIKNWFTLMSRYDETVRVQGLKGGVHLLTKIRTASLQAKDLNDYLSRLELLMSPKDVAQAETIIKHFYPTFEKWWRKEAAPKGSVFTQKTEALLKSSEVVKLLDRYSHFYEVILPDNYPITFSFYYRPQLVTEATNGEQLQNYSVAEFLTNEKPTDRLDVVLHELCHFFYDNGPEAQFAQLQMRFKSTKSPNVAGAANLLNETLATALGNGLINKMYMNKEAWRVYLAQEKSFYDNFHIDRAAKTIMPWLESWVTKGRTLYDPQFVPEYLDLLEKAMGIELNAAKIILKEMILVGDGKYGSSLELPVRYNLKVESQYTSQGDWSDARLLKRFYLEASTNTLIVIHPDNFKQLKKNKILSDSEVKKITDSYKKTHAVIYSTQTPTRTLFIVAAPNYSEVIKTIQRLGAIKHGFEGVYTEVEK